MKPHIVLLMSWTDSGHKYQRWDCFTLQFRGTGANPLRAYYDWLDRSLKA